jgi:hypothetical protein
MILVSLFNELVRISSCFGFEEQGGDVLLVVFAAFLLRMLIRGVVVNMLF